jgi:hypothetical protein
VRFTELEPSFLKFDPNDRKTYGMTDNIAEADGVSFVCPKCFAAQGRPGSHSVICWTPKVPQDVAPMPGRWNLVGTGYGDLSLVAGSSSVLLMGGCNAHFFVRNGEVIGA